jgi:hypothetical protein
MLRVYNLTWEEIIWLGRISSRRGSAGGEGIVAARNAGIRRV